MNALLIALLSIACSFVGVLFGLSLSAKLPEHHLNKESREAVKLGAGLMATLVALILGLLVSSAKETYDEVNSDLRINSAQIIMLDRILAQYGADSKPIRDELRRALAISIDIVWPKDGDTTELVSQLKQFRGFEKILHQIRKLSPHNEEQKIIKKQALGIAAELWQGRWYLIEEEEGSLPVMFLVVMVLWLSILFTAIGLLAPHNATVVAVLFVCSVSAGGAIFLVMEMSDPLRGMMKLSNAPLVWALQTVEAQ